MKKRIRDFILVTIGSFIAALGVNAMLVDNNIASGGVIGLAISLKALFGWNPGNFTLVAAGPLLLLCWIFLGKEVFFKTVYGSWIFPSFIKLTESIPTITHNQLLAAIFGGLVLGLGLGIVFYGDSSTGGTGIITQILNKYTPIPLGIILLLTDGTIVAISAIAFPPDTVMYSIMSLVIVSFTIDTMMTGLNSSRNILIISNNVEEVKSYVTQEFDRGLTQIPILGGYSEKEKKMLMTTVSTREFPKLQKEILKIDPTTFMIVMPASQVLGRGFSLHKNYKHEEEDFIRPM